MSGNPSGSNVVPMPHALAPASNPAQPPMPFPMWGGGGSLPWGPGCCPPGGMDALMKCYCDVQAATAFICSVMVQCVQNNPAVAEAIIAAIEKSGSSVPLLGITNGQPAQPGQVGEFIQYTQGGIPVSAGAATTTQVTMGILQPGDWYCTAALYDFAFSSGNLFQLNPSTGFSTAMQGVSLVGVSGSDPGQANTITSFPAQLLNTVPTLVNFAVTTNFSAGAIEPGQTAQLSFFALRTR